MADHHAMREAELARELEGSLGKLERGDKEIIRRVLHDYRVELLEDPEAEVEDLKKRFDVICLLAGISPKAAMHVRIGGMPKLSPKQLKWAEQVAREAVDGS